MTSACHHVDIGIVTYCLHITKIYLEPLELNHIVWHGVLLG